MRSKCSGIKRLMKGWMMMIRLVRYRKLSIFNNTRLSSHLRKEWGKIKMLYSPISRKVFKSIIGSLILMMTKLPTALLRQERVVDFQKILPKETPPVYTRLKQRKTNLLMKSNHQTKIKPKGSNSRDKSFKRAKNKKVHRTIWVHSIKWGSIKTLKRPSSNKYYQSQQKTSSK